MVFVTTDAIRGDAGPNWARSLLTPPVEQSGKTLFLRRVWPVELRGEVVEPAIFEPFARVAGELLVAVDASLDACGNSGPPYPKWADANTNPRFEVFDRKIKIANEVINVTTAFGGAFTVGKVQAPGRVRVEIIVKVDTIDIITFDDIKDHVECAGAGVRVGRIAPSHGAKLPGEVGRASGDVVFCDLL